MNKKIYIVRHCHAEGQNPEAQLTEVGQKQALELMRFFSNKQIDRIISSPYIRAFKTIEPLAEKLELIVEEDSRLVERTLSSENMPDWYEKLRETFNDENLKFAGGETSKEAKNRAACVISDVESSESRQCIIVTHGNLMSLLLRSFNKSFDFEQWEQLTNPDVFLLSINDSGTEVVRVWEEA